MKKIITTRAIIVATVATVFMMATSLMPLRAQFLYRDSHLFVGQPPSNYTTVATASSPRHLYRSGLQYRILGRWPELLATVYGHHGNYKFFVGDNGNVGVGRKATTYKPEVNGQVWTTGGLLIMSDATQKRNVRDLEGSRSGCVAKLRQLKGKSYEKLIESGRDNAAEVERMVASGKIPKDKAQEALQELNGRKKDTYRNEYGFIAQDVKDLFPDLAKGVNVYNLTANGVVPGSRKLINP